MLVGQLVLSVLVAALTAAAAAIAGLGVAEAVLAYAAAIPSVLLVLAARIALRFRG